MRSQNEKGWQDGVKELRKNKKAFADLYHVCFDENGNVLNCGREACKRLMERAYEAIPIQHGYRFGDLQEGFMNTELLTKLYNDVISK